MAILIQVQNISTAMSDGDVNKALAAVQAQVSEDAVPIWQVEPVTLSLISKSASFAPGVWRFIVADTPAQVSQNAPGAAGDHDAEGGVPVGYAFAQVTISAGMNPTVTISHEVLEMLGDSLIDQCNQWSDLPSPLFLAQELCDPVEDDSLGYTKNGVLVSDFVTPTYFIPGSAGPWDFRKQLTAPNTLATGGYQLTWDPTNGWQQKVPERGATGRASELFSTRYSRRLRRMIKAQTRSVLALRLSSATSSR